MNTLCAMRLSANFWLTSDEEIIYRIYLNKDMNGVFCVVGNERNVYGSVGLDGAVRMGPCAHSHRCVVQGVAALFLRNGNRCQGSDRNRQQEVGCIRQKPQPARRRDRGFEWRGRRAG